MTVLSASLASLTAAVHPWLAVELVAAAVRDSRTPPVSVGAARCTWTLGAVGLVVCAAAIAGWARPTEHLRGASRRRQRWRTREANERWDSLGRKTARVA